MKTLKFKSNINCTGCLSKVTPILNDEKAIHEWNVDLESKDRILTVKTDGLSSEDIQKIVSKAGFNSSTI